MNGKNADERHVDPDGDRIRAERRAFLAKAGRFAAATPPAIVMMLSVADKAKAQTTSRPAPPPPTIT